MQTPSPADHAARCRELAREHGIVVYDRADGRGRHVFHPSSGTIALTSYEVWGTDWHDLPLCTHLWAPDLECAAVLACGEFKHITRLVELPAPASSAPEQPGLPIEPAQAA